MTLEQFLEKLRKTPRKWDVMPGGMIRMKVRNFWTACPITCLGNNIELKNAIYFDVVGKQLGLPDTLINEIVNAADGCGFPELREQLLDCCGIDHPDTPELPRQTPNGQWLNS